MGIKQKRCKNRIDEYVAHKKDPYLFGVQLTEFPKKIKTVAFAKNYKEYKAGRYWNLVKDIDFTLTIIEHDVEVENFTGVGSGCFIRKEASICFQPEVGGDVMTSEILEYLDLKRVYYYCFVEYLSTGRENKEPLDREWPWKFRNIK
jgi:hypothetical protein